MALYDLLVTIGLLALLIPAFGGMAVAGILATSPETAVRYWQTRSRFGLAMLAWAGYGVLAAGIMLALAMGG